MIGDGYAAFMGLNMGKGKSDKAANGVGNAVTLTILFGVVYTIFVRFFWNLYAGSLVLRNSRFFTVWNTQDLLF